MMYYENDLLSNIKQIRDNIDKVAAKCGRSSNDIKIIAVTKTVESEQIKKAIDIGITDLGENRVQELCEKYDKINRNCNWHLIGHLQTNKVKYAIDKVSMIHSVDRLELVKELQKRAEKIGKTVDILIQVNVAEENSKFGVYVNDTLSFVRSISTYKNIKVKGLMTIAPYVENAEEVRPVFSKLRKLLIDIREENIDNIDMDYLSMGMSNDYKVAIEEGSNIIRIGSAIFGRRI